MKVGRLFFHVGPAHRTQAGIKLRLFPSASGKCLSLSSEPYCFLKGAREAISNLNLVMVVVG